MEWISKEIPDIIKEKVLKILKEMNSGKYVIYSCLLVDETVVKFLKMGGKIIVEYLIRQFDVSE